jgi:hypothetical protein
MNRLFTYQILPALGHPTYGYGDPKAAGFAVNREAVYGARYEAGAPVVEVVSAPRRKDESAGKR